ncbi:MAG: hypothetical protein ACRD2B_07155 [Terriglobia bacterium]
MAVQVEIHIKYTAAPNRDAPRDASAIVIWLTPVSGPFVKESDAALARLPHHFELIQLHKRFEPHLLVVPVGSAVAFPNRDPFFHNVFSLFSGQRFDLGLYEAGATRTVKFDRAGVSYIFCNIHPQMSAVVIAVTTPYYAVTNKLGVGIIPDVPDGRYRLQVWSEHALPKTLANLAQELTVRGKVPDLKAISIQAAADLLANHKNMYGRDYDPATPADAPYAQ